ncbi:3-hydroxy-9,10-secoandrosta-1,3,5(10)-triene-9,17-dione monooxygenase oxygenase subunit [Kutzneria buriramensis]|uniref:Flavin-dependent monooxygenase, oxygenase subunit HsaA n=1 Tax=Kutzneria buriramensis TaxID=1045776 RepID=A0A3E0H2B8_9PSEU|nr:3-hydroxy-9,10-secoandrosta-1,3,5(10)-triene-9,17-dione monooxygenase oxygenase subunit [Kutzneria buriramensis]REH37184.1 3-hydroxy-9,10-secoandrosta-1,3,5(10)-triene-9,17-dione monooxygenase [Kutzneria buriramensis]
MSEQVTAAVREVLPALRERAQDAEDRRRVPDESIKALQLAGVFKLLQPARYGGLEADPITFYETVRLIAGACGSTGWVSSVVGIHPWQLGLFPDEAQRDVWGDDPDARISSSYAPMGRAKLVEGGYEFSGRWSFSSGCDHASWVFLGGIVTDGDGKQVDFCTFLLPRKDYVIEDVWDTVGLRGTGSNDIIVDGAFVPEHRALSFAATSRCVCPGQELNTAPLYKLPFASLFSYAITTPIIGMATGAYEAHVEHMSARVRASYKGERSNEDPFAKVRIATAASEIDAAWLQLKNNMTELMGHANRGERIPLPLRLRIRRDQVRGTGRSIEAIDLLFENSGGRALRVGTPIQRFWRDAHAGRVHAINDPERALAMFGNGEFGIPVQDAML